MSRVRGMGVECNVYVRCITGGGSDPDPDGLDQYLADCFYVVKRVPTRPIDPDGRADADKQSGERCAGLGARRLGGVLWGAA